MEYWSEEALMCRLWKSNQRKRTVNIPKQQTPAKSDQQKVKTHRLAKTRNSKQKIDGMEAGVS
jgi:hypothetical protein